MNNSLFQEVENGAFFSADRKYRYVLWRKWNETKPMIMFIGLNPSTADEDTDDPTIRRVMAFAKSWGYGGIYMMNIFAIVGTDPKIIDACDDPRGDNKEWLNRYKAKSAEVVFAWGNHREANIEADMMFHDFKYAKCLFKNKNGSPKHPLYCSAALKPIDYFEDKIYDPMDGFDPIDGMQ